MARAFVRLLLLSSLAALTFPAAALEAPQGLRVHSRQLRVDLEWQPEASLHYEIQRGSSLQGPFETVSNYFPQLNLATDFIGRPGGDCFYRVRSVRTNPPAEFSNWSPVAIASPLPFNPTNLLTEVQEAAFRYFYNYAHPVSGLAREGTMFKGDQCAIGASGMGLFNLVVGIERGFITRPQGVERALKMLRFLSGTAERFHGAFPHMINGATGKPIKFSTYDDGADLVETAYLAEGLLLLREYFAGQSPGETEIRSLSEGLWREIEWDWFAKEVSGRPVLLWHWSPNYGWKMNHAITGFNECQIVYLLALSSPTHPVAARFYFEGWEAPDYGTNRIQFGIPLQLGRDLGPPLFWTHYSYLGLDPRKLAYQGRSYFDHFRDFCRVQVNYSRSRSGDFKGYDLIWGLTASMGPEGYRAFAPGAEDNGTIAPTAAISSLPYLPEASLACLAELYAVHGRELWGPFGFYDAFNLTRNWVAHSYLGIDQGPIAPMIENHRSGLCWKVFLRAPEVRAGLKALGNRPERRSDGL